MAPLHLIELTGGVASVVTLNELAADVSPALFAAVTFWRPDGATAAAVKE